MAEQVFGIKINGIDNLVADAKRAGDQAVTLLTGVMVKATTKVQEDAKRIQTGSFRNRTGNLRRSIFKEVHGPAKGIVAVSEKYALPVEFGSKPHTIYPKKGKFLAFKTAAGRTVFAKKVNHPRSKAYPFMEPAFKNNIKYIVDLYGDYALNIVNLMAGK